MFYGQSILMSVLTLLISLMEEELKEAVREFSPDLRSHLLRIKWHVLLLWKIRNQNQNKKIAQDITYFYVFQKKDE